MSLEERQADLRGMVRQATKRDGYRPTGQELFDSLTAEEQDEMLGPEAAELVRTGEATLEDFVERDGGFIRQKPVQDLDN